MMPVPNLQSCVCVCVRSVCAACCFRRFEFRRLIEHLRAHEILCTRMIHVGHTTFKSHRIDAFTRREGYCTCMIHSGRTVAVISFVATHMFGQTCAKNVIVLRGRDNERKEGGTRTRALGSWAWSGHPRAHPAVGTVGDYSTWRSRTAPSAHRSRASFRPIFHCRLSRML